MGRALGAVAMALAFLAGLYCLYVSGPGWQDHVESWTPAPATTRARLPPDGWTRLLYGLAGLTFAFGAPWHFWRGFIRRR